ncbi:MAG TPA: hypothetical protein VMN36_04335 [Verrucomicrobiales bacterium]|nr:hypothetical protein [Verrucomicrobiales bacterium]
MRTFLLSTIGLALAWFPCLVSGQESDSETSAPSPDPSALASITGVWEWVGSGMRGGFRSPATLTLESKDGALAGTYSGGFGPDAPIEDAALEADALSFKVSRTFGDRTVTTAYSGRVSGDRITGSIETETFDGPQTLDWKAWRKPAVDPSGSWTWTTTAGRDESIVRTNQLKLRLEEGAVKGMWIIERGQAPLSEVSLKGNELSFRVAGGGGGGRGFGNQGNQGRMTSYRGTISADAITGTVTRPTRDGDVTEDWKATRAAPEVDPLGVWSWETPGRDGETTRNTLEVISRADGSLVATLDGPFGESQASSVTLTGDLFTANVDRETDNGSFTTQFEGRIDGDAIHGLIKAGREDRPFRMIWDAARVVPAGDPAGEWVITVGGFGRRRGGDVGGAQDRPALRLNVEGTQLTGTISGRGGDTPISNGKVENGEIQFSVERSFGDRSITQHYKGRVRDNRIFGTYRVGTGGDEPGAWETFWEAQRPESGA